MPPGAHPRADGIAEDVGISIVGLSDNGVIDPLTGYPEAFGVLWSHGRIHNLGALGGNQSFAVAINNRGQVTGLAENDVPVLPAIVGLVVLSSSVTTSVEAQSEARRVTSEGLENPGALTAQRFYCNTGFAPSVCQQNVAKFKGSLKAVTGWCAKWLAMGDCPFAGLESDAGQSSS